MNKLLLLLIICLNGSILLACQQKQGQTLTDISVGQAAAASSLEGNRPAKPGAQVSLASDKLVILAADKATTIDILLSAQLEDGVMHLELNPGDGLQLRETKVSYDFVGTQAGLYPVKANLYAAAEGRYYLNLNTTISKGGESLSRSLAIIVQVGPFTAAAGEAAMQKMAAEEDVISLPAQEQIINQ